jgi:hypothetical protein
MLVILFSTFHAEKDSSAFLDPFSNVLAVNPEDNTLLWSVTVQGYIVGTPVMGADGTKFYVSHNAMNENGNNQGFVTVMSGDGVVLGNKLTSANGPYGPLAVRTDPEGNDLVMWATSNGDGFEPTGQIHVLAQDESGGFQVQAFTNRAVSSVTRLALSDRGVWMGGFASTLSAWTMNGTATADETYPAWDKKAQPTERNVSQRKFTRMAFQTFIPERVHNTLLFVSCYSLPQCASCVRERTFVRHRNFLRLLLLRCWDRRKRMGRFR